MSPILPLNSDGIMVSGGISSSGVMRTVSYARRITYNQIQINQVEVSGTSVISVVDGSSTTVHISMAW